MNLSLKLMMMLITLVQLNGFAITKQDIYEMVTKDHKPISEYSQARKLVFFEVDSQADKKGKYLIDVYCNQKFYLDHSTKKMPNDTAVNIEHTWPQSRFNKASNVAFQKSDLHHLYPTVSRANSTRGNFIFSDVADGSTVSDDCGESLIGKNPETMQIAFEPPARHKGNVARSLFYFSIRYNLPIAENEEKYLRMWHELDPVDDAELRRDQAVSKIQGNHNPFVLQPGIVSEIKNF